MDTTLVADFTHGKARSHGIAMEVSGAAGYGPRRILALIASCALSGIGFAYALMRGFAEPKAGSGAQATERLLRQPDDPSVLGLAIVIVLVVAIATTAAIVALHRHAE